MKVIVAEILPCLLQTLKQLFLTSAYTFTLPQSFNRIHVRALKWPTKHFNLLVPMILFHDMSCKSFGSLSWRKNEVSYLRQVVELKVLFVKLVFDDIFLLLIFGLFEEMLQLPSSRNIPIGLPYFFSGALTFLANVKVKTVVSEDARHKIDFGSWTYDDSSDQTTIFHRSTDQ